jgi:glutamine---fructose-6-phosphate transaminase (isomerizing)
MSIAAMRWEIENQAENLEKITRQLANKSIRSPSPRQMIFTGSGDSWAAAMFASELANKTAFAEDPGELLAKIQQAQGKRIVIISTSGRTHANLELAKRARTRKVKTIAVTSNPTSLLAEMCDESLILDYNKASGSTSGTISFTASILACAKLLRQLPSDLKHGSPLSYAEEWARNVHLPPLGNCVLVGSGVDRAIAEYGACKIQEVLGATAIGAYPEQVGHALLFSLNKTKDTIVCVDTIGNRKTRMLYKELLTTGFRVFRLFLRGQGSLKKSLDVCSHLQYLALVNAERNGRRECAFLSDKQLLRLSNKLIY